MTITEEAERLSQTPDGAVVYGMNAFADLDVAQLSTSDYGVVFIVMFCVSSSQPGAMWASSRQ